jgi:CheY-like chemotaxis protein
MKLLIVEDDEIKRTQLAKFISEAVPQTEVEIARSYQSGIRAIIERVYKLIILDMTMPTFDIGADESGGRPQAYAGREILRQMDRRNIKSPVIVVTQFDRFGEGKDKLTLSELNQQLLKDHPGNYLGAVYYNTTVDSWKDELLTLINKYNQTEGSHD